MILLSKMASMNDDGEFQRSYRRRRMNTRMLHFFIWHIRELCRELSQEISRHETMGDGPATKV